LTAGEREKAQWVRGMFGRIAGRYDLLNHLLSFNLDKRWRARTVKRVSDILARPDARVLDLCCGTGDVLLALEDHQAWISGSDFCHPMLLEARRKTRSPLFEADALALPLKNNSLDLITCAFGFRNLANYDKGLEEVLRVLKPGGVAAILEFSQPTNRAFGALYQFFSNRPAARWRCTWDTRTLHRTDTNISLDIGYIHDNADCNCGQCHVAHKSPKFHDVLFPVL
jgi:demethylmenaquinone methyltransferase/2-methoxy-6-polyprenyl-1,4-benzoquinol methylase